jgi:4-hydroxy-3-methylbut-2-enyl diphosphate reductase
MRILRAEAMGMCFGVRDALAVIDGVTEPAGVTIHGELVHNETVLAGLRERGFAMVGEADRARLPTTDRVLVTAHGISDTERRRLEAAGKSLVDTTCPLVVRAHRAARGLEALGYHVLVVGKRGHVEIEGIVGDLEHFHVLESVDDVETYPQRRLGVLCQTTATERHVQRVRAAIEERNPHAEIRFVDTVCRPTKERQRALARLLEQVDAMVVVGGRNSNNTRELARLCEERGVPTRHVQGPGDLDPSWFRGCRAVGLTAGTSTLPGTIEAVAQALESMAAPAAGSRTRSLAFASTT